jgi:drug/metabolite transporter (DMT)-like permease
MGEIAAFLTAVCWAGSSVMFTVSGLKVGAVIVNRTRLLFAVLWLTLAHLILMGQIVPLSASLDRWFWLGLSGIVGLVIGDAFLLQAYVMIGARIATLIMAIVPVISAIFAWILLGESLTLFEMAAIALVVGGIAWVVMERTNGNGVPHDRRHYILGVLCAIGAAVGQALGLVLSKKGLEGNFPALSGVLIRMLVAAGCMWLVTFFARQAGPTFHQLRMKPQAIKTILVGSIVGPFLGVWLSLVAIQTTIVGIASTLMALTPVVMLPVSRWVFKEKISWRAVLGTGVAMGGVALLFLK